MPVSSQDLLNLTSRDFKSLDYFLIRATPDVSFFGKKQCILNNWINSNDRLYKLNFSSIIAKGNRIQDISSSRDRKIGKKLEAKLKKFNDEMDKEIKNSPFITRCFAFLRSFFSRLNPFSTTNNFIKNGFERLNYYTEDEWRRELPTFSLPKYPDKIKVKFTHPTALYKTPAKINNFGRRMINSLWTAPWIALTSSGLILASIGSVIGMTYMITNELEAGPLRKSLSKICPFIKKKLDECVKQNPVQPFGYFKKTGLNLIEEYFPPWIAGPCHNLKKMTTHCR